MKKLLLLSVIFLAACSDSNTSDLEEFIAQTTAKPKGRIAPLPEFKPYSAFIYSASAMRSPFESPVAFEELNNRMDDTVDAPDQARARQALERYNLSELSLVGTLSKDIDGKLKALIKTQGGNVHMVEQDQFMGKNHGRIVKISDNRIDIIEVVPNGSGGWISRPQTLGLNQSAGDEE
ncbi:pilus assembly protein PilP [Bermanella sp. WJH001]|uniref:pilus assembly protein PilP n=1 Tax=Bermanella sp. WJH001 TaxID=3048005 RepID=UPI0024BEACED|nr:pilus assembly protein PilP [Bermanella sp. WJH001]MDJ1539032.1 pilus assembly protein PilP [Bermanella sp. WJH001]